jgi:hypothetical protein
MSDTDRKTGSCLCGAVRFTLTGPLRDVFACHCSQCRKTSGHYWSATGVARKDLVLSNDEGLRWFDSSDHARRGFCQICGSSLFWDMHSQDHISVAAGSLDGATGLTTDRHIFCAEKGDYYDIEPGPQQFDKY